METGAACGVCGTEHRLGSCPTLIRAIGAADRTADLLPSEGLPDPLVGSDIGEYELTSVLGVGSYGVVYRAVHRQTQEVVALKLLHAHLSGDVEMVRRFVGEARATLLVAHDNVVQVKSIAILEGQRYFIVLELLEGETLEQRCARGPIPFEEAAPLLRQMCDGLGAAHVRGIVHRDLKPENIYLTRREHRTVVKVMDFGVARRSHLATGEARTRHGLVIGTPQYLSPEQSLGLEVDQRTDVYSLGVIMFRMLTGQLPFTQTNAAELIAAHRVEPPPAPSQVLTGLPPSIDALVLKALTKNPDARFQTMERFEAAIAAAEAQSPATQRGAPAEAELLRAIESMPESGYYQLFDVREGGSSETISASADRLEERLARGRVGAGPEVLSRFEAAARKVAAAKELLLNPRTRVALDARNGNFVGVARAISTGFDLQLLNALRELFLLEHPELENAAPYPEVPSPPSGAPAEAAAAALARRLREDPLNLELHRRYWPLRNALKKRGGASAAKTLPGSPAPV